jgi:type IV secretory pathway VirJ component
MRANPPGTPDLPEMSQNRFGLPCAPMLPALLLAIALLTQATGPAAHPKKAPSRVKGVPLVEVPAVVQDPARDEMAVLLTGDGGWAATDKGLSETLAKGGIPVVGWNSLHYFLRNKQPDRAAQDLERVLRVYLPLWHKERVILIGYSFGADVMPFLATRLPPDLAAKVSLVVLMGPSGAADFRFHPTEWLGKPAKDSLPVLPEIEKLRGKEVLCAYGIGEKDSFCLQIPEGTAHRLTRPGGHIVGENYRPITDWILHRQDGASPASGVGAQ